MRVQEPVVVITGASSGIGRATAHRFAGKGARLVLAARGLESLEAVAAECRKRGAQAIAVPTDVTNADEVEELASRAVREFGRLDVWVNNAAVGAFGLLTDIPPQDFQRVLDVNISGYVNGARAALRRQTAQGSGTLINVSSVVAEAPVPYSTAYSISKAAVRALSISLRSELDCEGVTGVNVCTVLPATIDTPFYQNAANVTGRRPMAMPPVYSPHRVAKAVVGLVSHPRREAVAGGLAGRLLLLQHRVTPRAAEAAIARQVDRRQLSRRGTAIATSGNLHRTSQSAGKASVTGGWHGRRRTVQRGIAGGAALACAIAVLRKRLG